MKLHLFLGPFQGSINRFRSRFLCLPRVMNSMNVSSNETQPSSDACLLPVTHIIVLILINLLSIIIGTIGNALVIATVYTNVTLQIISNFWLASMAVADLMVTALAQPLLVAFWGLQLNRECNEPVVETFRLVIHISCSASVLHLCFISIDRCLLIVRPLECKKIRTMRRFKIVVAISWTIPVIFGVLSQTISRKETSYFVAIGAALCYLIIISCYTLIVIKVWNRKTETLRDHAGQSSSHLVERRVTVTIAVVVVVFTVCWVPLMFLRPSFAESNVGVVYMWWGGTVALSNSAMNPWIYCFRMTEFRATYKKLLRCGLKASNRDQPSGQYQLNKPQSTSKDTKL